jgi:protein-S-isoprenylcysteine O-methyltransferase Ste14
VGPLYVGNPAVRAVYWAVTALWVLTELSYFVRFSGRRGSRNLDRWSGLALVGGVLLAIWAGSIVANGVQRAAITSGRPVLFATGVVTAVAGIAFRWYAIRSLGQFFGLRVQTRPDQFVVDTGPYRLVRHPSYTGGLMTIFGVLLCSTNWLALLCFLIALPGFAYRIRTEERALMDALGEPYSAYMGRTKRLVPYVL